MSTTDLGQALPRIDPAHEPELTDEDIIDALQHIQGYVDISLEDFRQIYHLAWHHAMARLQARQPKGMA